MRLRRHARRFAFLSRPAFSSTIPQIGEAIWLLLFYVDRTTEEIHAPDGRLIGRVLGGCPMRDGEVARAFRCSTRTVHRWRRHLVKSGYIRSLRTPYGCVIEVVNSQKWPTRRCDRSVVSSAPDVAHLKPEASHRYDTNGQRSARNAHYKEDKTETIQRQDKDRNAAAAATAHLHTSCALQKQTQQRNAQPATRKQQDFVSAAEALQFIRKFRAEFEAKHPDGD
ncbi:MAG TPA: hypothetical protein VJN90_02630 [Candidatus Acidoferrales bacterium]|nr:hypothetical protein [Candidatus Acidoferrales bacterium]